MKIRRIGCVLVLLLSAFIPLAATDSEHYGSLELHTSLAGSDSSAVPAAAGIIDANHRLYLSEGEFFLHHEAETDQSSVAEYTIHEAYLALFQDWGNLTFGRHRIPWGTGIFFSPTDALHPVSLTGEAETGFDGLSGTRLLSNGTTVTMAVSFSPVLDYAAAEADPGPDELGSKVRGAVSLGGYIGTLDWRTTMVYQWEKVFRPGISFSADLAGWILSLEGALELHNSLDYLPGTEDPELWDPYALVGSGIEKSWIGSTDTLTIISEYLYDQQGYSEKEAKMVYALLEAAGPGTDSTGTSPSLGRHYLNASIEYAHDNRVFTEHGVLLNLQDPSGVVSHALTYTVGTEIDFRLEGSWCFGGSGDSEFGLYAESAAQLDEVPDELAAYSLTASVTVHF